MNRIVLLGHGIGIKKVIDTIQSHLELQSQVVAVITHPRIEHKRDLDMIETRKSIYGDCAYNVFNVEVDYQIPLFEFSNVNDRECMDQIDDLNPDYIISLGCRNILKKDFLNHYSKKVFNIHTTPLPKYRGAASDTWMILNGEWEQELFGCFHEIDTGIDSGNIIAKHPYVFPKYSYPIDVFKIRISIVSELLIKALTELNSGKLNFEEQDNSSATVFPRLLTSVDGRIDFNHWRGEDIEKFIYAFGYPFEGAHCFIDGKRINILECHFTKNKVFHPLAKGLIYGKDANKNYKVAISDGTLLIEKIEVDGISVPLHKVLRLGKRLE